MREGDANTRFFHLAANSRRRAYQILRLKVGEQGYTGTQAIGRAITSCFWAFTKKGKLSGNGGGTHGKPGPTSGTSKTILGEGSPGDNKRSKCRRGTGPGQPPCSEFWGLVSFKIMATLEEFQHGMGDMTKINKSHLFLLPKCQGVYKVEDFRPISLPKSIYFIIAKGNFSINKIIIAKVLANSLWGVIGELV